jgi:site-specific DNA-methyltransferase (adenine-specific)
MKNRNLFYNEDCIEGCKKHFDNGSVDLIITDPPYGINGDQLHKHYNRKEDFVIPTSSPSSKRCEKRNWKS